MREGGRYNPLMSTNRQLPDPNRLSVLTAAVLLALALTRFIRTPALSLNMQVLGDFSLPVSLNLNTLMTILAAGMTATGMDWLLRTHPALGGKRSLEHIFLPTMTVFIIGALLSALSTGMAWWLGFGASAVLMVLVFQAEFVAVDDADAYYPAATSGLMVLAFALYLILAAAMHYAGARLFWIVPALFLCAGLISLRSLHLRLHGRWEVGWAAGIALICTQLAAALHYWPISPLRYGLLLLGPLYGLTMLASSLREGIPLRQAWIEPGVMAGLICAAAFIVH